MGANTMWHCPLMAIVALNQLWYANGIVRAAAIPSAFTNFSFWQWTHDLLLLQPLLMTTL